MIENFNKLSKEEVRQLEKFILSPFFNERKIIQKYFYYFKSKHPNITKADLSKKEIHKFVYGRTKFNAANIKKIASTFGRLFDRFLIQIGHGKANYNDKILLSQSLRSRYMLGRFFRNIKEMKRTQTESFHKDEQFYINQINSEEEYLHEKLYRFEELQQTYIRKSMYSNYLFIYQNLVCYIQILLFSMLNKEESLLFKESMFKEVMSFVRKNKSDLMKRHPNIIIYYLSINLLLTYDEKYYDELLKYYNTNKKRFTLELSQPLFLILTTYNRRKLGLNLGNHRENNLRVFALNELTFFKTEYFKKYFLEGREMDYFTFISVVKNSAYLGKIEWLKLFYERYKENINKGWIDDAENFMKANIFIFEKNFVTALFHLTNISYKIPYFFYESQILRCIVLFELQDIQSLYVIIRNLKKYIMQNEKISISMRPQTRKFLKYISNLIKIYKSKDVNVRKEVKSFRSELDNDKELVLYREWFYDKLS